MAQGTRDAGLARQLGHTNPACRLQHHVHSFERCQPRDALGLDGATGRNRRRKAGEEAERQPAVVRQGYEASERWLRRLRAIRENPVSDGVFRWLGG